MSELSWWLAPHPDWEPTEDWPEEVPVVRYETEVRKPSPLASRRIFSMSGWSPTAVATKPSWLVTGRARSSEARMYSVGCQRKRPMPKLAQQ